MKHEKEINEIKTFDKVYFTFRTWDNFLRRANPANYRLVTSEEAIDNIIERLPSICSVEIHHDNNYPYPLVEANL